MYSVHVIMDKVWMGFCLALSVAAVILVVYYDHKTWDICEGPTAPDNGSTVAPECNTRVVSPTPVAK
jgi:hypothetical protein